MPRRPVIPGYRLLDRLGGGPCCEVFAADPQTLDEPVAIKTLKPEKAADPKALTLLEREARAAERVSHRHLIRILDRQLVAPPYFLVLELLPGQSAKVRVRSRGRLPLASALAVARQVAEALAALHAAGFIHGDVKSDNIRLVSASRAVLLDLGFAHAPGEHPGCGSKPALMGTPNYMAPELCTKFADDTAAADIFSLGVTLVELLTGKLPYPGGTAREVVQRRPTDGPAQLLGDWPPGLPELVATMTDPEPDRRPSAKRLVQKLIALQILTMRKRAG